MTTYADSGVNIELGDDVSKILYNAAKETWKNRKGKLGELIVPFDDFTGIRAIDVSQLPKGTLMNIGFDGVGTKMELAERINDHCTIAYDLFAMVCDDAVVREAEPVLIGSILDVNSLGKDGMPYLEQVRQLAEGYIGAAQAANVAIVNGEVAELGERVGGYGSKGFAYKLAHEYISLNLNEKNWESMKLLSTYLTLEDRQEKGKLFPKMREEEREFVSILEKIIAFNYNWGAAVVWFAQKDRLFTGYEIQEGDWLIGLREEGFRSNGLSLVRRILQKTHGDEWHTVTRDGESLAKLALHPSRIYSGAVVDMFGGYAGEPKARVHGVAHITGGGLPGKLGRVLKPSGLGATIDNPFPPSWLMLYCQEKGGVTDEEAYRTWNMGQGMVVISPEAENVLSVAESYNINAKVIGHVTSEKGIRIKNGGYHARQDLLTFS